MGTRDERVDEKIAKAPAFAQPVMRHLRELVHEGCPETEETIKWGMPFFLYRGKMLCSLGVFSKHCSFGFVGPRMREVMREAGMPMEDAAGSLGRLTSLTELPKDEQMLAWIRQAAQIAETATPKRAESREPKAEAEVPEELLEGLRKSEGAQKIFDGFSASCRREYVEWIVEAKRAETRERRVTQAVEWIAEGKTRNWKYQSC
ncbi:MAG: hypothetical protein NVSMB3_14120 [Acidobacteriaceae bacterium]